MSKTILLADDSLTIQKVVELTFSDTDFEVIATSGGEELLERLPSSGADIIICDTIMPGIDGYAVCQSIKSESTTLHLPVILMTGTFEPFDRDRALAAGCSEIITKPFEARNLVETVERLVTGESVAAPAPEPFAGSVAPPKFGSAVTPPAPDQGAPEFGTMLSPPPDVPSEVTPPESGDELDFTSTGFAEMEAAGAKEIPDVVPEHGLDFESSTAEEPEAEALEAEEEPEAEPTQPVPAAAIDEAVDPFGAAAPGMFAQAETPEAEPEVEEPAAPEAEPEPLEAAPVEPDLPESTDVEAQPPAEFPIDTDPVVEPAPEGEILPEQDDDFDEMGESLVGGLSDADIDRIARKVVELAADRLEKIAWDVIPDMAEIVVRERVRELEDDIENAAGITEPN